MNESTLYKRQETLDLTIPESVMVIGLGGVGSWVAYQLALSGVKKLVLIDYDHVEEHNRNRTPFKIDHVGMKKVDAIADIIWDCREGKTIEIYPIDRAIDTVWFKDEWKCDTVVDCRDNIVPLPSEIVDQVKLIGGYDGTNVTLHFNPRPGSVFSVDDSEERVTYSITPSWLLPPVWIASVITYNLILGFGEKREKIITKSLGEFLEGGIYG